MFNSDPRLSGQPTSQPTNAKVKVPRSGYRGTTSHPSNVNEPDPNGDVTLVVSPPVHPPLYKQHPSSFGTNVKSSFSFSATLASAPATSIGPTVSSTPTESKPPKTRFRVSSKQLMLASAYFEKMLTPRWQEGQALGAGGSIELNIPETDPYTLLIILDIIHCRRARVPRVVNFDKLIDLAVLADYFQCHEALEPYPSIWLESLREEVPSVHSNMLVKWIFVSWVFNYDAIFSRVTRIAQRQATYDIYLLELPIPESIYGEWHRMLFRNASSRA